MKTLINRFNTHITQPTYLSCGVFLLLLFLSSEGFAQLKRIPLERETFNLPKKTKSSSSKRTKNEDPLILPFFDDFSFTSVSDPDDPYSGFPRQELWDRSYEVWINEGLGINAPTINVATFDGLDSAGRAYSTQTLENGFRDMLTSRKIDLSLLRVGLGERPGVYLSFFYQWQGNGEPPDANDDIRVEFLDLDSVWIPVLTIVPLPEFENDEFYQAIVQVNGERFFHDAFRFRFRNYGRLSGPYDTWNIDYIYLNKGRNASNLTYPDRAIASRMSPIFGAYRSVPLEHFRIAPIYTPPRVDIQSLRPGPDGAPTDYDVLLTFNNYIDETLTQVTRPFGPVGSKYPDNNLQPGERYHSTIRTNKDAIVFNDPEFDFESHFLPDADSIKLRISLGIYEPDLSVYAANDTISEVYHLKDFYAYDDGTAEFAAVLSEPDDQVAYRFDMLTNEPQQLVGFDVYIPQYGIQGFTTANFFVMDAENDEPNEKIRAITHVVRNTGRDAFQRVIIDPVIVEDKFFIGWRGSFTNQIKVGLDYSNNTTARIYEDINGVMENGKLKWFPNTGLTAGSLMIRPNFGDGGPVTGIPRENKKISIYPNPTNGTFFIDGKVDQLKIISTSGQEIFFQMEPESDRARVTLDQPQAGVYILHIRKSTGLYRGKLVIF